MKDLTISIVFSNSYLSSRSFNFSWNLIDREIYFLERLMSSLTSVCLSPITVDSRAWSLSSFGLFLVKSFFMTLSKSSNPIPFFLSNFIWKSKPPSKFKAFAWLVVHKKVNTNDLLHVKRPYKSLSLHWCILCKGSGESIDHFFLHCLLTLGLWYKLFSLANLA